MRSWVERAIWWQVYPLGFVGAEREACACGGVAHRLGHLGAWLEYATNLGVSGILLGPIFASSTHGYDTIDHFQIDKRLGDSADFDEFIDAAHRRGLRVVLDGVFNHVGRECPAFQRAIAGGPHSPEASWFRLTWPADAAPGQEPAFWARVLSAVRARHPDAYIFGEVIHGDYTGFVRETGVDGVTQYELWKAIWSSLNDLNLFELAWALDRHNAMLDTFVPQTFIGNHDVTRIASQLLDERYLAHALVILLTCAGVPSIYAGDEQAFRGIKEHRAGGDDAIRPAFPATPADLAPFGWPIYRLHQELIGLRRRHPWLHRARSRVIELRNTDLTLELSHEENRLWVALNLADAPITRALPAAVAKLAGDLAVRRNGATTETTLPPHGWGVFASP